MSDAIVKHEPPAASDLLTVIAQAVTNPALDVVKMQALLGMHKEILADQRKEAFDEAMSRLQAKLPQIAKYGQAKNSRFATLEDLDIVVRPLLAEEGFSLALNEAGYSDNTTIFTLDVSRAGHTRTYKKTFHNDKAALNREGKGIRPAIQDDGATTSYARRYLLKMALNIVERSEDTDGESLEPITAEQAKDLEALAEEVKADKVRFLKYMQVESFLEITNSDFKKAISALESKRGKQIPSSR